MTIITSNIIFQKILEYCWEFDDIRKSFYWVPRYSKISSDNNYLDSLHIVEATQWKLNLMMVSSNFLNIILSNFEFNLQSTNLHLLIEKRRLSNQLQKIAIQEDTPPSPSTNNIEKVFNKQRFNIAEIDFEEIIELYQEFGKQWYIELVSNLKKCIIIISEISLLHEDFFYLISLIGNNKNCSITLLFGLYSFDLSEINKKKEKLLNNYKRAVLEQQKLKQQDELILKNVDTLILEFELTSYANPIMELIVKLFYECFGTDDNFHPIKNIYAFNQQHLTFLPYYFRDFKNVENLHLHTDIHNTFGRPIFNTPEIINNLKELTYSIDSYDIDNFIGCLDYSLNKFPPKHLNYLILLEDRESNEILTSCRGLESLSIFVKSFNLLLFKHQCIQNPNSCPPKIGLAPFPSTISNLSISFLYDSIKPIEEIQLFSSFFNHPNLVNLKYFNFKIMKKFDDDDDQLLLEILFNNGLKNCKSLECISIYFEYVNMYHINKKLSIEFINKLLLIIIQNTQIKGILFDNLEILNYNQLPIKILDFKLYPFSICKSNGKSIYYYK